VGQPGVGGEKRSKRVEGTQKEGSPKYDVQGRREEVETDGRAKRSNLAKGRRFFMVFLAMRRFHSNAVTPVACMNSN